MVSLGAAIGCDAVVRNGDGDGGGSGGAPSTTSSPNTTGPNPDPAGTTPPKAADGYARADDFGYDVRVGDFAMTCGSTSMPACSSEAHYALSFRLDDADVFAGNTIPLHWETSVMDLVGADDGQGCGIGFANLNGLVEITGVDADSIQMRVSYGAGEDRLTQVAFDVPICGDHAPAPTAIAMTDWEYQNGGPGTTNVTIGGITTGAFNVTVAGPSTGTAIDYDTLHLFIGSRPPACEYPTSIDCSEPYWNVHVMIPSGLQYVGTYLLQGIGTFTEGDVCYSGGGGGGSFWQGTIQILAIDDYNVTFTLAGTNPFVFTGESADGTYTAPRCW